MQVIFDKCLLSKYHTGLVSKAVVVPICRRHSWFNTSLTTRLRRGLVAGRAVASKLTLRSVQDAFTKRHSRSGGPKVSILRTQVYATRLS
jgi:hypothetical protein